MCIDTVAFNLVVFTQTCKLYKTPLIMFTSYASYDAKPEYKHVLHWTYWTQSCQLQRFTALFSLGLCVFPESPPCSASAVPETTSWQRWHL